MNYRLLDTGLGKRLEQFGSYTLVRPCAHAAWAPTLPSSSWEEADATFTRTPTMQWHFQREIPPIWETTFDDIHFHIKTTDFGHVGLFPEQQENGQWITQEIHEGGSLSLLNLFGYSGAITLAAARAGAEVCHVDAAKGMVDWARENAERNHLEQAPIRWIIDDATKFLHREARRGRTYDAIVLDPPSFGRGTKGEVFTIGEHLLPLLRLCEELLSSRPRFLLLSCHTPGYSALVLEHVLQQTLGKRGGLIESGEMVIPAQKPVFSLPSGFYARWKAL